MFSWKLVIDGVEENYESRAELLERVSDLLEDVLMMSPLADAEVIDPHGQAMDIDVGINLAKSET